MACVARVLEETKRGYEVGRGREEEAARRRGGGRGSGEMSGIRRCWGAGEG